jgi:hypothetical protein
MGDARAGYGSAPHPGAASAAAPGAAATAAYAAPAPAPLAAPAASAAAMTHGQLVEAHAALTRKIRSQASELGDTLQLLQSTQAYARLVERRLLEAVPDHPLPVSEGHLGLPITMLSKLAVTAAVALLASPQYSGGVAEPPAFGASAGLYRGGAGGGVAGGQLASGAGAHPSAGGGGPAVGAGGGLGVSFGASAAGSTLASAAGSLAAAGAAAGSLTARASHIIAATAAHRREAVDSSDAIRRLEKSVSWGGCR